MKTKQAADSTAVTILNAAIDKLAKHYEPVKKAGAPATSDDFGTSASHP